MRYRNIGVIAISLVAIMSAIGCGSPSEPATSGGEARSTDASTHHNQDGTDAGSHSDASTDPLNCRPSEDLRSLYRSAQNSFDTLSGHGRLELQIARDVMVRLLLTNWELYDEQAEADIRELLEWASAQGLYQPNMPLEHHADGTWWRPLGPNSHFEMQFRAPNGNPITYDVFDVETYFDGIHVSYDMSFEEMKEAPDEKNTWTVTWDEPGPLFHLLESDGKVPNPFVVHASLFDLVQLSSGLDDSGEDAPDFGPLRSLLKLEVDSTLRLSREVDDTSIQYVADSEPRALRRTIRYGHIPFELDAVHATDGRYTLSATSTQLDFRRSALFGSMTFEVTGPDPAVEAILVSFDGKSTQIGSDWHCQ